MLPAEDKLIGDFILRTDNDVTVEEYVYLEGRLTYIMDLPSKMKVRIGMEVSLFEVNPHELTFRFGNPDTAWIRLGYEENSMTLEEYRPRFERPITSAGLVTEYYDFQGYVERNIGATVYHKYEDGDEGARISWWSKISQSLSLLDPQLDGAVYYHFDGEDSYLGGSALYIPYFINPYLSTGSFSAEHYFSFNLTLANLEGPFIYGIDAAFGSNQKDPIGLYPLPVSTSGRSYHSGIDALVGWKKDFGEDLQWTPAIRTSLLLPDCRSPEYFRAQAVLGNKIIVAEGIAVFLDLGLRFTNAFGSFSATDRWTFLWNVGIQAASDGIGF